MKNKKNILNPTERIMRDAVIGQNGQLEGAVILRRFDNNRGEYVELIESPMQVELDVKDFIFCTAEALAKNDPKKILRAVVCGANINTKDLQGNTALHYAIMFDYNGIDETIRASFARLLLKLGALSTPNDKGKTPLDIATEKEYHDVKSVLTAPVQELTEEDKAPFSHIEYLDLSKVSWSTRIENAISQKRSR